MPIFIDLELNSMEQVDRKFIRRNLVSTHPTRQKIYNTFLVEKYTTFELTRKLLSFEERVNTDPANTNFPKILEEFDKFTVSARLRGEIQCGKKYKSVDWSPELARQDDLIRYWKVISRIGKKTSQKYNTTEVFIVFKRRTLYAYLRIICFISAKCLVTLH